VWHGKRLYWSAEQTWDRSTSCTGEHSGQFQLALVQFAFDFFSGSRGSRMRKV